MPDKVFDDLPVEIKLHVFSFLSLRESFNVLHLDHANHEIIANNHFWRDRIRLDFYINSNADDARAHYDALKKQLRAEEAACLSREDIYWLHTNDAFDELLEVVRFGLIAAVKSNVALLLRVYFGSLAHDKRELVINRYGAELLASAIEQSHVESMEVLLNAGVSPNVYCTFMIENNVTYQALPLVLAVLVPMRDKKTDLKEKRVNDMMRLLFAFKANPDLPGIKQIRADGLEVQPTDTVRKKAGVQWAFLQSHPNHYSFEKRHDMGEMLQFIISAPSCYVPASLETDNHNDCVHSMHTSHQRPHRPRP